MLSEADTANRLADEIFARIRTARGPSGPIIPAGFEHEAERASDLRRQARNFRAQATPAARPSEVTAGGPLPTPFGACPAAAAPVPAFILVERVRCTAIIAAARTHEVEAAAIIAAIKDGTPAADFEREADIEATARRIVEAAK